MGLTRLWVTSRGGGGGTGKFKLGRGGRKEKPLGSHESVAGKNVGEHRERDWALCRRTGKGKRTGKLERGGALGLRGTAIGESRGYRGSMRSKKKRRFPVLATKGEKKAAEVGGREKAEAQR